MTTGILYISYDGMLEPLGQSQVIAYLKKLSEHNRIHLISFEKSEDLTKTYVVSLVANTLKESKITWHPLRYHKSPSSLATSWDILNGIFLGLWLVIRHRLVIVHARSYVAALMGLVIKKITGLDFLFDMRGFWADERVDGGLWRPKGYMFRITKWLEKIFILNANHIICLTNAAKDIILKFDYVQDKNISISVIPTCADLSIFKPYLNTSEESVFVLGYVGSAGTWYEFDAVVKCFNLLRQVNNSAKFLIINNKDHIYIRDRLFLADVPMVSVELLSVNHSEIPMQMARMSAGIFFYKQSYSRVACSPTKLGEFLGCGLPCLSNSGVGDMTDILEQNNVGVVLCTFDEDALMHGLSKLITLSKEPLIRERCVEAAYKYFSLDEGVRSYKSIYKLMGRQ